MGKLEQELKRDIRKTKIHKAIIGTIAVAGILSVAMVAPNALSVLGGVRRYTRQKKYELKSSLSRLIAKGYVGIKGTGRDKSVYLTEKGERFAALADVGKTLLKKPKQWDGKWRLLIFDVPERRKKVRLQIRTTLKSHSFYRLQDSVWVYPYDCEDFITILKIDMRIGMDLLYVIADKIENDRGLREHFGLR